MRRGQLLSIAVGAAIASGPGCVPKPFEGPLHLLAERTTSGAPPRTATLTLEGEARPALIASASFRVRLPRRPLLTFGFGVDWAGEDEAPGWYRLEVRAGNSVVAERQLNPRAARGWRDVSLPLQGLRREAALTFELRLTDRDGRDVPVPQGLLLAVSDPMIHDLDAYGRSKGVVVISIDTLRPDHMGSYGYEKPTTPRLDALAGEGVLFEDAVSTSSWTLPAHLSLLTSVDPGAHGGTDLNHGFNQRVPTLAELLRAAGFATRAVTSHLYVSAVYGLDRGFDHLDFHQDRKAADVANHAIDLLDRFGDRPFFLFLHLYDPHWHYDPPEAQKALFETGYRGTLSGMWQDFSKRDRGNVSDADLAHLLALYDGEIRYVDDELARVFDHMKRRGLDRGTLVVVSSDHGEEFLEHGSWEHQKTLYEEVIRIPLVLRGPGIAPRRVATQVSLLDVAPTVLQWAGVGVPAVMQGSDLLRALDQLDAFGETDHTTDGTRRLFLRGGKGRWKAILSLAPDGKPLREEWYDLGSDPGETRNAAPAPEVAARLRAQALARWHAARGRGTGAPSINLTPEQRERLRALGYVGP